MTEGIEFDEDKFSYAPPRANVGMNAGMNAAPQYSGYGAPQFGAKESWMVRFLIKHGLAKSAKGAQMVQLGIVVVNIIVTVIVVKYFI